MTITEFLLARIAEDEKAARAAAEDGGGERWQISVVHSAMVQLDDGTEWGGETVIYDEGRPGEEQAAHIALHDPARVLAECKAKRRIVEWHTNFEGYDEAECCEERWGPIQFQAPEDREISAGTTSSGELSMRESFATQEYLGCVTLMMLATAWADHPDYREEWRA